MTIHSLKNALRKEFGLEIQFLSCISEDWRDRRYKDVGLGLLILPILPLAYVIRPYIYGAVWLWNTKIRGE